MIAWCHKLEHTLEPDRWYAGYRICKGKWVNAWGDTQEEAYGLLIKKLSTGQNPHAFRIKALSESKGSKEDI